MEVCAEKIPNALKAHKSWVLWREIERDGKPTKMPFRAGGGAASSTDPSTWCDFETAIASVNVSTGIGFVFSESDPYCGIDLDGCFSVESGMQSWAKEIIHSLDTYGEWSPSKTGVKLIVEGKFPLEKGKNKKLDVPKVCDKEPGIEIYNSGRFFAITGNRGSNQKSEPQERTAALEALAMRHFSHEYTYERAKKYIATIPPAISGSNGSKQTCKCVLALVRGFGLDDHSAMQLLREYNSTCAPPWSERELLRRIEWAKKQSGVIGYLRDARGDYPQVQEFDYRVGIGDALEICMEAISPLELPHRKAVLAALQASLR